MRNCFLFILWTLISLAATGQGITEPMKIELLFNEQPLVSGQSYQIPNSQTEVTIETLKFYISEVRFYKNQQPTGHLEQKHLLIDMEDSQSLIITELPANLGPWDELHFLLGIDSITNTAGAMGQDLDPTQGMYWTWQSGYINWKLEGTSPDCPARKNRFQYHIGGYSPPFKTQRKVVLPISNPEKTVIQIDIGDFFEQVKVQKTYQVMSPNAHAVEIADILPTLFKCPK